MVVIALKIKEGNWGKHTDLINPHYLSFYSLNAMLDVCIVCWREAKAVSSLWLLSDLVRMNANCHVGHRQAMTWNSALSEDSICQKPTFKLLPSGAAAEELRIGFFWTKPSAKSLFFLTSFNSSFLVTA